MKIYLTSRCRSVLLPSLCVIAGEYSAQAATVYWTGDHNKFWGGNATNWSPSGVPADTDDVYFDGTASLFTVDLGNTDRTAASITIDSATAYSFEDQNPGQSLITSYIDVESGSGHSFNVPIILDADATVLIRTDLTVSGVISGGFSLEKISSGTLFLTGNNTYSGGTSIQGGTLQVGAGGTSGSILGDVSTASNATLVFNRSDDISFDGLISGSGNLTQAGSGSLTLNAANTFSGDTAINAGSIILGNSLALQNSTVNINVANGLDLNNASATLGALAGSGDLSIADGATLTVGGNDDDTAYSGVLSGAGGLTKTGSGQLSLSGVNTFTGDTHITEGSINLSGAANFSLQNSTVYLDVDDGLTYSGASPYLVLGTLAGSGDLYFPASFEELDIGGNDASTTYSGALTGDKSGYIYKKGSGDWTLTGAGHDTGDLEIDDDGSIIFDGASGSFRTITVTDQSTLELKNGASISAGLTIENGTVLLTGSGVELQSGEMTNYGGALTVEDSAELNGASMAMSSGGSMKVDDATLTLGYLTGFNGNQIYLADPSSGSALTVGQADDSSHDYKGVISDVDSADLVNGLGSLTKVESNTQILSGANDFSGGVNIYGGTLQIGAGGTTGSITSDVYTGDADSNGTLAFNRSDDITYGGLISGSGGLAQNGSGNLTLTAANTFTGDTDLNAGKIVLGNALALQNSTVNFNIDNGLDVNGLDATLGGLSGSGNWALPDGVTTSVGNNDTDTTYAGILSGTGNLVKTGAGTLSLSGESTFTGDTIINEGAIKLIGNDSLGSYNLQNSTVYLNVDYGLDVSAVDDVFVGSLAGSGNVNIDQITYTLSNDDTVTFSGALTNASSSSGVYKYGSGDWTLTAAGHDGGDLEAYDGSVILDGASGEFRSLSSYATGSLIVQNGADLTLTNYMTSSNTLYITGAGTSVDIATTLTSFGELNIEDGANVSAADLIVNSGNELIVDDAQLSAGFLTGFNNSSIRITDPLGASALTLGNDTYDGISPTVISDGAGGAGSVTKVGSNVQVFSSNQTYTGGTSIYGGTLQLGNDSTAGWLVGDVYTGDADSNGVLAFARSDDVTFSNVISGSGGITQASSSTLTLTGANTFTGGTTIYSGGVIQVGDGGTSGWIGGDVVNDGELIFNRSDDISYGGVISGAGDLTKNGAGDLTLNGANTFSGDTTIGSGKIILGDGLALQNSNVTVDTDDSLDFNGLSAVTLGRLNGSGDIDMGAAALTVGGNDSEDAMYTGALSGTGSLTKTGSNVFILIGANTFTGGVTISDGTLAVANVGSSLSISGDVLNNGELDFTTDQALTFDGLISGTGAVSIGGSGLTLTAANTYSGVTYVNSPLTLGNALALQNSTVDIWQDDLLNVNGYNATLGGIKASGSLDFGATSLTVGGNGDSTTYGGVLSGSGGLTKEGDGTIIFNNDNDFTGGLTINSGAIQLGEGGTKGWMSNDVVNDGTLIFKRSDDVTFSNLISGSGGVTQDGTGSLTLTEVNTFSGDTAINAGSIILGNALALQNSTVYINVDNGLNLNSHDATLGGLGGSGNLDVDTTSLTFGSNDDSTTYSGILSGTGTLTKYGEGSTALTGDNTFSGTLNIDEGEVIAGTANALTYATVAVNVDSGLNVDGVGSVMSLGALSGSGDITFSNVDILVGYNDTNSTYTGAITGGIGLYKYGSGVLYLTGQDYDAHDVVIEDDGVIVFDGVTGDFNEIVVDNANAGFSAINGADITATGIINSGTLTLDNTQVTMGDSGEFIALGDVTSLLNGSSVSTGYTYVDTEQNLTLMSSSLATNRLDGDSTSSILISDPTSGGSALTVGANDESSSYAGSIQDSDAGGSLTKVGAGTLTLSGANTYTGGTTISGGSLQIGNGGTTGSIAGDVLNNGTLIFDRADAITFAGLASGSGGLTQNGASSLTLTAANTFSGETNINAGSIILGNALALQNSTVSINVDNGLDVNGYNASLGSLVGSGALDFGANALSVGSNGESTAYSGVLSGSGSFNKYGAGTLTMSGASDYTGGTNIYAGAISVDSVADLGDASSGLLLDGGSLNITGSDRSIARDVTIGASGGTIHASGLVTLNGDLALNGNTVTMANGLYLGTESSLETYGTIAGRISGSAESAIAASGGDLTLGDSSSFTGFNHAGTLDAGANSVTLNSRGFANLGVYTSVSGGSINAANGVALGVGDNLEGSGSVNAKVAAASGSTIYATGDLTLGDASSTSGFSSSGELYVGSNAVTINDANQAGLGTYTEMGGGIFTAVNGLVVDFEDSVIGSGDIVVGDTSATSFINNGYVEGTGDGLFFDGYVKGVGTFAGTVGFSGTLAPGLSPGGMYFDNLTLTNTSTLAMELGGWTRGTEYDFIDVTNALTLDGDLVVTLYGGFTPEETGTFNILDWGTISGTFASIALPDLPTGYYWSVDDLYTTGDLSIVVPEPQTYAMLIGAGALLAVFVKRRRRSGLAK
ncbi:autotransporter-associated beta strand repeat-containing protein [Cerasicoccus fimbriatus]|uniref:autotransporter-associated beta strand repeat-containing protein n=1 Tax=Cerasicoccus fimbriatus TaxID=3014554 RepID=UPI0022B37F98|nr:autotransporter-associated beta strand repeat-containing protein [Cerasicoccus sp. TK19100]